MSTIRTTMRTVTIVVLAICLAIGSTAGHGATKKCVKKSPSKSLSTRKIAKTKQSKTKVKPAPLNIKSTKSTKITQQLGKTSNKPQTQQPPAKDPAVIPPDCYTSLIIDATGLKLDKARSVRILRKDGSEVWGTLKNLNEEDLTILEERGMVGYATTIEDAKSNPRSGSKPLIIKAVDTSGGRLRSDMVISDEDAAIVLAENAKGKFLEKFNVIFVRNENPPPSTPPTPPTSNEEVKTDPQTNLE